MPDRWSQDGGCVVEQTVIDSATLSLLSSSQARRQGSFIVERVSSRLVAWVGLGALLAACSPDSSLKVNNHLPVASIVSHADGDEVLEDSAIPFRGKGTDVDDRAADLEAAGWASGELLCDWTALDDDGGVGCDGWVPRASDLVDGSWSVDLEVRDDAGGSAFASASLDVLSSDAPVATILSPDDGTVAYADQPLSVYGQASDDLDAPERLLATWSSSLDGVLLEDVFDAAGDSRTSLSLSEGIHDLVLTATDTTDRAASDAILVTVFATNTDPTCTFTSPVDGGSGRPDAPTEASVTVADGEESAERLRLDIVSDRDGLLFEDAPDADGTFTADVEDLSVGTHLLTLTVDDTGGGRCTETIAYTIGTAPVIELTAPTDGDVTNEGDTVAFSATVTDGEDAAVDLGVEWTSDLDGVLASGAPDGADISAFSTDTLSLGDHTITVAATDRDTQTSERVFTLGVNGLPDAPEVSLAPDPAVTDNALVECADVLG